MKQNDLQSLAKAEAFLNATLAYQAGMAIHHLKHSLGVDVERLTLDVAPHEPARPTTFSVICTIHSTRDAIPIQLSVSVDPADASFHGLPG